MRDVRVDVDSNPILRSVVKATPAPATEATEAAPEAEAPAPAAEEPTPAAEPVVEAAPAEETPAPAEAAPAETPAPAEEKTEEKVRATSSAIHITLFRSVLLLQCSDFSSSLFPHIHLITPQPAVKAQKVSRRLSSRVGDLFKPKPKKETAPAPAKVEEAAPKLEEPAAVAPLETEAAPATTETPAPAAEEPAAAAPVAEAPPAAPVVAATA